MWLDLYSLQLILIELLSKKIDEIIHFVIKAPKICGKLSKVY